MVRRSSSSIATGAKWLGALSIRPSYSSQPFFDPSSATKCSTFGSSRADRIDGVEIVAVDAKHARAAVVDDVDEIVGGQPIVDRNEHRADLRHGVERLKLRMRVGRDIGDAVARLDPHLLQRGGPAIAAVKELRIGEPEIAVDDSFPVGIEPARASRKFHWRQGDFHWATSFSDVWVYCASRKLRALRPSVLAEDC